MAEESGSSVRLLRWCGIALVPAGALIVVAALLHPSRETATTIIASEAGLVAAHFLYTPSWLLVLLGLPRTLCLSAGKHGTAGIGRLPGCISGIYLIAVGRNFGFFAPVLAKEAPAVLDAIAQYWACGGHQWAGCDRLHDWLHPVRGGHD
jgi:hypothetical protein